MGVGDAHGVQLSPDALVTTNPSPCLGPSRPECGPCPAGNEQLAMRVPPAALGHGVRLDHIFRPGGRIFTLVHMHKPV
jgi:hypothetical protein